MYIFKRPVALALAVLSILGSSPAFAADLVRPLYARPASTSNSIYLDAFIEYFDGLALQEAVDLQGWTGGLDFTFPFRPDMQFRLLLPVRTEAQASLVDGSGDIDIEGWGGTFRFATLFFEHQLIGVEAGNNRLSYFLGYGNRTAVLETGTPDRYNHRGRSLHGGLRFDRLRNDGGHFIVDGELRSYEDSDDLNPGSLIDDRFLYGTIDAAWIGAARGRLQPALELTTRIADNFFSASLVPELILSGTEALQFKFGVPIGLSADAPDWGAQFRLSVSF